MSVAVKELEWYEELVVEHVLQYEFIRRSRSDRRTSPKTHDLRYLNTQYKQYCKTLAVQIQMNDTTGLNKLITQSVVGIQAAADGFNWPLCSIGLGAIDRVTTRRIYIKILIYEMLSCENENKCAEINFKL